MCYTDIYAGKIPVNIKLVNLKFFFKESLDLMIWDVSICCKMYMGSRFLTKVQKQFHTESIYIYFFNK